MPDDQLDPQGDPFRPPETPVEVSCLHCGETYESYLIEWQIHTDADGTRHGFWCCPTPGCGGMGFGFDIFPTDPEYQDERGGWVHCDEGMTKNLTKTISTRTSRRTGPGERRRARRQRPRSRPGLSSGTTRFRSDCLAVCN